MKKYNVTEIRQIMGADWVKAAHPTPILRPTDIMLGDWVLAAHPRAFNEIHGCPVRVYRLHDDTTEPIGVETHKDAIIRHQILASFIIPLPLITEILERNATEVVTDGTKTYYLFGEHYAVRVIGESMCFCFICRNGNQIADRPVGDIFDVHTLQHLLRLPFVGLSDVANNLII